MALSFQERLAYDAWNFLFTIIGYPTTLPWMLFVLWAHNKILYVIFGTISFAFVVYTIYLYWTGEAKNSTITQVTGDTGPTYDYYWMCIIISSIYMIVCVMAFLNPDEIEARRNAVFSNRSGGVGKQNNPLGNAVGNLGANGLGMLKTKMQMNAAQGALGGLGSAAWKGTKKIGSTAWSGTKKLGSSAWKGTKKLGSKLRSWM